MPLPNVVIFQCLTLNLLWQPLCMSPLRPDWLLNSSYLETNLGLGHFFLLNLCQMHERLCLHPAALLQVYIQFMNPTFSQQQQKLFNCGKVGIFPPILAIVLCELIVLIELIISD